MNVDRLLKLRAVMARELEAHKKLHMGLWKSFDPKDVMPEEMRTVSCGTAACALGCYALSPEGKADDWRLCYSPKWSRAEEDGSSFDHARQYFGLSSRDVMRLFDEDAYDGVAIVSPGRVIEEIDAIIEEHEND